MIKTFCKLFYNKFLSICYDTQQNSQDDIIIDFNKYDNINIDYKIQKKTDFYNSLINHILFFYATVIINIKLDFISLKSCFST